MKPKMLDAPLVALAVPNASKERDPTRVPFASVSPDDDLAVWFLHVGTGRGIGPS